MAVGSRTAEVDGGMGKGFEEAFLPVGEARGIQSGQIFQVAEESFDPSPPAIDPEFGPGQQDFRGQKGTEKGEAESPEATLDPKGADPGWDPSPPGETFENCQSLAARALLLPEGSRDRLKFVESVNRSCLPDDPGVSRSKKRLPGQFLEPRDPECPGDRSRPVIQDCCRLEKIFEFRFSHSASLRTPKASPPYPNDQSFLFELRPSSFIPY